MSEHELDARNLLCPLPVIRTQDAIRQLRPGDRLRVHCTDPGALHDIPTWCRINGHRVCDIVQEGREINITVEVADEES